VSGRIDAHVHAFSDPEIARLAKANPAPPFGTVAELFAGLDVAGVERAVVANFLPVLAMRRAGWSYGEIRRAQQSENEWLLGVAAEEPRLRALIGTYLPLRPGSGDTLAGWLAEDACVGVRLHPSAGGYEADAADLYPIAELLAETDKAMLIHAGFFHPGHRETGSAELLGLVAALPETRIVIAHLGGSGSLEAIALLEAGPNVWLDTSRVLSALPITAARALLGRVLDRTASERIVHGSDFPFHTPREALARLEAVAPSPACAETILTRSATYAYDLAGAPQALADARSGSRSPS
jgi:predicted TIM-barrel fold metal-dependent hydrolase